VYHVRMSVVVTSPVAMTADYKSWTAEAFEIWYRD